MTDHDEALLSVVYSSHARDPFDEGRLRELLAQSRAANEHRGVTGMLLYRGGRFVQILEGPEQAVRDLLETIEADDRHTGIRVLIDEFVEHRNFADWTMGYEQITEPHEQAPDGFRDTFDDLERGDASVTLRAARELSLWFRVRASHHR